MRINWHYINYFYYEISYVSVKHSGHSARSWLRYCATNGKGVRSIPDYVKSEFSLT